MTRFLKKLTALFVCTAACVFAALSLTTCYLSVNGTDFGIPYTGALKGVWEITKLGEESFPKTEEIGGVRYTTRKYMYVQSASRLYSAFSKTNETTHAITAMQKIGPIFYYASKKHITMDFEGLGSGKKSYTVLGSTIVIGNSAAKDALVAHRVSLPSAAEIESWPTP